ncbi:hypothetical protein [[Leptolyngbya] sp. PCC 7376]|nr:hypothetical protein [[Leptolyngbya] sp. PCC 7376]
MTAYSSSLISPTPISNTVSYQLIRLNSSTNDRLDELTDDFDSH